MKIYNINSDIIQIFLALEYWNIKPIKLLLYSCLGTMNGRTIYWILQHLNLLLHINYIV